MLCGTTPHQLFIPVFTPNPCGFLRILNRGKGAALPDVLILVIFIWCLSKEMQPQHASSPHADINIYCPGNAGSIMLTGNRAHMRTILRCLKTECDLNQKEVVQSLSPLVKIATFNFQKTKRAVLVSSWVIPAAPFEVCNGYKMNMPTLYSNLNVRCVHFRRIY